MSTKATDAIVLQNLPLFLLAILGRLLTIKLCSEYCKLDEIGNQMDNYCAIGEFSAMITTHLMDLFCNVAKRLASKESVSGIFDKGSKF